MVLDAAAHLTDGWWLLVAYLSRLCFLVVYFWGILLLSTVLVM